MADRFSRRGFLRRLAAGLTLPPWRYLELRGRGDGVPGPSGHGASRSRPSTAGEDRTLLGFPDPEREIRGDSSVAAALRAGESVSLRGDFRASADAPPLNRSASLLRERFDDLPRHFVFEYYPWYGTEPWRHWNQWDRVPPTDVAATSMPALGPYDSRDFETLERHARWIRKTGAGAVNLSWWGRDSFPDRAVDTVMDVMRDHDIKVTFHLEPYRDDRGEHYAEDVLYLVRRYGDRRGWDCMLLLTDADGGRGPVFKSFRTIVPEERTDCHGDVRQVPDHTPDLVWRRQTRRVRRELRREFDHVTLLADSLDFPRTRRSGFDGIAIYDNFVDRSSWAQHAREATEHGLVFSFNCNPGYDEIRRRNVPEDSCYSPNPFLPETAPIDWERPRDRRRARRLARRQIRRTLKATLGVQTDPALWNAATGFFLVYVNSFNEWHEGHQFEPMLDRGELDPAERAIGYHNQRPGNYRLRTLARNLRTILR